MGGMSRNEIHVVARQHDNRHAIVIGLVNGHGRVLDSDGAMQQGQHWLAFRLGVAVRHGDCRLFMQRGDPLRHHIRRIAVIDERTLAGLRSSIPDSRPRIRFRGRAASWTMRSEPGRVIRRTSAAGGRMFPASRKSCASVGAGAPDRGRWLGSIAWSLRFHQRRGRYQRRRSGCSSRCVLQEAATANGILR